MNVELEYQKVLFLFSERPNVQSGQMFGKSCLKVNGKAFMAQHRDTIVFKLAGEDHAAALATSGAHLWDPSGKGRPMKEWVALPIEAQTIFQRLAESALSYVRE
jgi:hypothetical protein